MGMGPTATVGFLDENGKWTPVSATNSLPTTGGGGGGGGTDLTSYTQVSSLPDYPTEFPPDVSSISPEDIGAQPAGSYATGAQGALADTAVQPGDLATVATTGAYGDLTGTPTIPATPQDIGAQPAGSYATGEQGAKADTALQSVTLANLPAGTPFVIVWDGTGWTHGGQTITERPTSRTDVTMLAYGGTTAPEFAIAGDLWTEDADA